MRLAEIQRRMAGALMAPLEPGDRLAGAGARAAEEIIKPNGPLGAAERMEIYARSYWYRLLDVLYDDFAGLRAVVGARAFNRLSRAYLAEMPSESFTLRNLGRRLPEWLERHAEFAGANHRLATDMARLEWASVVAFDGPEELVLGPEDLVELGARMTLRLQPYVTLLELAYPVDDLHLKVSELAEGHGEASNAVLRQKQRRAVRRFSVKAEQIYLAVHRLDNSVYFRRMEEGEFRVLRALAQGEPVADALDRVLAGSELGVEELRGKVEEWFGGWAEQGWFCHPEAQA